MISRYSKSGVICALLLAYAAPAVAEEPLRLGNPAVFTFHYPYLDPMNGGKPTPAARLASDPKAMQAYARRESGIDNRSASPGPNREALAALRSDHQRKQLAAGRKQRKPEVQTGKELATVK